MRETIEVNVSGFVWKPGIVVGETSLINIKPGA